MQSDSNLGGGTSGGAGTGGSTGTGGGLSGAGTGGSTGGGLGGTGTGGSTGGGLGGSTGSGLSGTGTGGSTGGLGGSTGGGLSGTGTGGSTGGLGGTGTGGSTGGLGGSTGGTAGAGFTEGGGFTTGDDFDTHEGAYRRHYTVRPEPTTPPPVPTYEEARTGYEIGHRAAANPTYANRPYEEVEVELERESPGRLATVRSYARHAFEWKTLVGALALAGGAWWVSRKLSETVSEMSEEEEQDCRTFYESHPARGTVPYEQARTVYVVGYAAARNPDYTGRTYEDVEPHLRSGFSGSRAGNYDSLRDFTRRGYERGSSRGTSGGSMGGSTGGSTGSMGGATGGSMGSTGGTVGGSTGAGGTL